MSRFLIFQFRELQGETDTSLPQRIVQTELAVVFALIMRAYADLRAYVGTAPAEDWNLPYFNTVRASEEKRKQHLFRFLTEPRGNIRTKNAEIWIEPGGGGRVHAARGSQKEIRLIHEVSVPRGELQLGRAVPRRVSTQGRGPPRVRPGVENYQPRDL